jgi:hypothetical protein
MKSCLNCKYEPDWGEETRGEYPRRFGTCKWNEPVILPACYTSTYKSIERHSDDSGVCLKCATWKSNNNN